jgi:hypothetical protein
MSNSSLVLKQLLAKGQVDVDLDSKDESSRTPLTGPMYETIVKSIVQAVILSRTWMFIDRKIRQARSERHWRNRRDRSPVRIIWKIF